MSTLLRDSAEGSVCVREMIDMVYSLACHPLHSTRWLVDGTVLLKGLIQIWPQQVSDEQWKDIMVLKLTSTVNKMNPLHTKQFLLVYVQRDLYKLSKITLNHLFT